MTPPLAAALPNKVKLEAAIAGSPGWSETGDVPFHVPPRRCYHSDKMFWEGWSIQSATGQFYEYGEGGPVFTRQSALQWLRRYRHDPIRMAEFRRLLDQPYYWCVRPRHDEAILEQVAWGLHLGRFRLVWGTGVVQEIAGGSSSEQSDQPQSSSSPPPPPGPRPSQSSTPAAPVFEEPTFPAHVDAVAIAESQKEAARLGIPFCEECARMAAANTRS